MFKRACSRQLEAQLNTLQKDGPAAWADLPEEELFTPAGFSSQQAEATASTSYSYWDSTFRAFFKTSLPWRCWQRLRLWWCSPLCSRCCPGRQTPTFAP